MAHQIASIAIFSAPLLTIAANPETILKSPLVEVIKSVPPAWDETIVLPDSEIGALAAYARRGNTWFLAVMSGPQPKTLHVPLSFLSEGEYEAVTVRDKPSDDAAVEMENTTRKRTDFLDISLREGGGFLARFLHLNELLAVSLRLVLEDPLSVEVVRQSQNRSGEALKTNLQAAPKPR